MASLGSHFSETCEVISPEPDADIHEVISRWSDAGVCLPALIVTPSTREDICEAIKYATAKHLTLVPGAGGHGVAVPIDDRTLYLNLRRFNHVAVDVKNGLVTFGGGATNEEVLGACINAGYYTVVANVGPVGMVGMVLGGGFSAFSGLHGFAIDHIQSMQIITALGKTMDLNSSSKGEEGALFYTICGGGYGLAVITCMTIRAFPISSLKLDDNDKLWVRKMIFPATASAAVAKLFMNLTPVPPKLQPLLIMAREPHTAPSLGAPMLMLYITYNGPGHEAEAAITPEFTSEALKLAISDKTTLVPLGDIFSGTKMFNAHGGIKEQHTARTMGLSALSIFKAFQTWKQFGDQVEDARAGTVVFFSAYDPEAATANGSYDGGEMKPFIERERPFFNQTITWYSKQETKSSADQYAANILRIMREEDTANGMPPLTLPGNMRIDSNMEEGYSKDMISEMKRVKNVWDEIGVFYSPTTNTA